MFGNRRTGRFAHERSNTGAAVMAYFQEEMPRPVPDMDDAGFWAGCAEQQLRFQACAACGTLRHPPTPVCGHCRSTAVTWVQAPQEGEVFSFTTVYHAGHDAVILRLPYVVALIQFANLPSVRLITNITDIPPQKVRIGMTVVLWWDQISDDMWIPRFKPSCPDE